MKRWAIVALSVSVAIAAVLFISGGYGRHSVAEEPVTPVASITIAVITHPFSTLIAVADGMGFFRAEGIDATLQTYAVGKEGIKAVVEGKADITTAADTGLAEALLNGAPLRIVAVVASSDASHQIIARKDRGIAAPSDLQGKRVGVTSGTFGDFCLDTYLTLNRIPPEAIIKVDTKPGDMAAAILAGKVDAVSSWEPITTLVADKLGGNGIEFRNSPSFTTSHSLLVHEELAARNPLVVERIVKALLRAEQFTKEHPEKAQAVAARLLGSDPRLLAKIWSHYSYHLMLDQDLIVRLEEQARWLIEKKSLSVPVPNLLPRIYAAALQRVAPDNVTLIQTNRP